MKLAKKSRAKSSKYGRVRRERSHIGSWEVQRGREGGGHVALGNKPQSREDKLNRFGGLGSYPSSAADGVGGDLSALY
jgi:hypothetical protein